MQMIHPLGAGATRSLAAAPLVAPQQRVLQSKIRARQQKILKSAILLLITASLICFLLIWRADASRLALAQRNLDRPVAAIQSCVDELGWLPGTLEDSGDIQSYAGFADRTYAMQSGGPAIIGVSHRVSLFLRPSGRYVVIYDHGKLRTQWMRQGAFETALREQAERMREFEEQRASRPPELP